MPTPQDLFDRLVLIRGKVEALLADLASLKASVPVAEQAQIDSLVAEADSILAVIG